MGRFYIWPSPSLSRSPSPLAMLIFSCRFISLLCPSPLPLPPSRLFRCATRYVYTACHNLLTMASHHAFITLLLSSRFVIPISLPGTASLCFSPCVCQPIYHGFPRNAGSFPPPINSPQHAHPLSLPNLGFPEMSAQIWLPQAILICALHTTDNYPSIPLYLISTRCVPSYGAVPI